MNVTAAAYKCLLNVYTKELSELELRIRSNRDDQEKKQIYTQGLLSSPHGLVE